MMDVSDGLLLDCSRLAEASGLAARIDLGPLPLSDAFIAARGDDRAARLFAATGGDDYALIATLPETVDPFTLPLPSEVRVTAIGRLSTGKGISLVDGQHPQTNPDQQRQQQPRQYHPTMDRRPARAGVGNGDRGPAPLIHILGVNSLLDRRAAAP
jgi:thiamine-monophosphate kinase